MLRGDVSDDNVCVEMVKTAARIGLYLPAALSLFPQMLNL